MKLFFTCLMVSFVLLCKAQENKTEGRDHKGFYLSMALGPVFGNIDYTTNEPSIPNYQVWSGAGAVLDLKIGGAIKENLILHATLLSNSLPGPSIKTGSGSVKTSNNLNIGESLIGGGLTYYIMPANLFLSGSLGLGSYTVMNKDTDTNVTTDRGFGVQVKIGKEWWVSKRWGLGVAATYGNTGVNNKIDHRIEEQLNSNRFGILFNATLN